MANGLPDAPDYFPDVVRREKSPQILLQIFLKISLFAELEDEIEVVGCRESFMQFDNMRVSNALYNEHLFLNHLPLLLAYGLHLYHLDCIALHLAFLTPLEDLTGGSVTDLANEPVVTYLF